jgi:hypothetical protein
MNRPTRSLDALIKIHRGQGRFVKKSIRESFGRRGLLDADGKLTPGIARMVEQSIANRDRARKDARNEAARERRRLERDGWIPNRHGEYA